MNIAVHRVSGEAITIQAGIDGTTVHHILPEVADRIGVPESQITLFQKDQVLDSTVRLVGGEVLFAVVRRPIFVAWASGSPPWMFRQLKQLVICMQR